jgi:DNA-binding HxlR family transcriptional regulator
MNIEQYYQTLKPNQKKIITVLQEAEFQLSSHQISELTGINVKSLSRYINPMVKEGAVKLEVYSPQGKTERYKLFSLSDNDIKIEQEKKINENKSEKSKTVKSKTVKSIDIDKLKEDLKLEIISELVEKESNIDDIVKARSEIVKIIMKLPIREVDKKELGLTNMSSNQVRNYIIDLLDLITIRK